MTRPFVSLTLSIVVAIVIAAPAAAPPSYAPRIVHVSHDTVAAAVAIQKAGGKPPTELIPQDQDLGIRVNVGVRGACPFTGAAELVPVNRTHARTAVTSTTGLRVTVSPRRSRSRPF